MTLPLRIELAMTLKAVFPDVWPSAGPDRGVLRAAKAVSGCNILICGPDASLLRQFALLAAKSAGTENVRVFTVKFATDADQEIVQYRRLSTSRGTPGDGRASFRFRSCDRWQKPNNINAIAGF